MIYGTKSSTKILERESETLSFLTVHYAMVVMIEKKTGQIVCIMRFQLAAHACGRKTLQDVRSYK